MRLELRYLLLFILIALPFFTACEDKPKNPVAEHDDALLDAHKKSTDTAQHADLDAIRTAVRTYQASREKFPESLKEIEGLMGSSIDIDKYDYNPQTGVVRLKPQ